MLSLKMLTPAFGRSSHSGAPTQEPQGTSRGRAARRRRFGSRKFVAQREISNGIRSARRNVHERGSRKSSRPWRFRGNAPFGDLEIDTNDLFLA